MMDRKDITRALGGSLAGGGFEGRGRRLRLAWPNLVWLVELDMVPRTERLGISLGVCSAELASAGWPDRANDCPIIFYPDAGGEPFGLDHWRAWQALDAGSDLDDDARRLALSEIGEAIAGLANRVTTLEDLKQMAAGGQLRGFVRKDARVLLEGGDMENGPMA